MLFCTNQTRSIQSLGHNDDDEEEEEGEDSGSDEDYAHTYLQEIGFNCQVQSAPSWATQLSNLPESQDSSGNWKSGPSPDSISVDLCAS